MHIKRKRRDDPQFLVGAAVLGPGIVAGVVRDVVSVDETHELPGAADRGSVLIVEVDVRFGFEVNFSAFREVIAPVGAVVGLLKSSRPRSLATGTASGSAPQPMLKGRMSDSSASWRSSKVTPS